MKKSEILYDLLQAKISGQEFYNSMMVRMVNPAAVKTLKSFRDDHEREIEILRKRFLALEARPLIFKTFLPAGKSRSKTGGGGRD